MTALDSESTTHRHWLFMIRTEDRPGTAASITAAFSGRGLQIESFIGIGDAGCYDRETEGVVALTFLAIPHRMDTVRRVLERLEQVRSVHVYDYAQDARLVKAATVRTCAAPEQVAAQLATPELHYQALEPVGAASGWLVHGQPPVVDAALGRLRELDPHLTVLYAILPPE